MIRQSYLLDETPDLRLLKPYADDFSLALLLLLLFRRRSWC
jgi:hypothetical protein